MARRAQNALLAVALVALVGCGDKGREERAQSGPSATQAAPPTSPDDQATPPGRPRPEDRERERLLSLLVPRGVPTEAEGQPADREELAVVKRWLAALTQGDIPAAAATFADGTKVQNFRPLTRLEDRADRLAFNRGFPCGAEIADASSVKGYLVVTYRLTDRVNSPCDGPGGTAAGTIKVTGDKMTEWYRLPDPPQDQDEPVGPEI